MALWLPERQRTTCSLFCGTTNQFYSQRLRSEQQYITGVMTDAPWIVLSRNGSFWGCSVLPDSTDCKLGTIEPTGKQSSLQYRPKLTAEQSKLTMRPQVCCSCSALSAPKLLKGQCKQWQRCCNEFPVCVAYVYCLKKSECSVTSMPFTWIFQL